MIGGWVDTKVGLTTVTMTRGEAAVEIGGRNWGEYQTLCQRYTWQLLRTCSGARCAIQSRPQTTLCSDWSVSTSSKIGAGRGRIRSTRRRDAYYSLKGGTPRCVEMLPAT